jgi:putative membrane protein insertion efficiency factor
MSTVSVPRETEPVTHSRVSRETSFSSTPNAGLFTALALLPVRAYRRFLSPLFAPRCRYYPSCSAYAEQSIQELGAVRGSILAAWRVLRCNPFSDGGFDEVADRRLFRPGGGS